MFHEPAGVSELAQALGISKSNAHRLLRTLLELGFVDSRDGRYWATLKVWELGSHVIKRYDVKDFARPFMAQIAAQTGEEVRLSIFDETTFEVIYIDKIDSAQDVRAYSQIGGRAPSYCTSSGKVFLAHQDEDVIARVSKALSSRTKWTITDPAKFADDLERTRADGYALNDRGLSEQVSGVAAPIFGRDGRVIASISVIGPAERFSMKRLREIGEATKKACTAISASMNPPAPNVVRLKQDLQRLASKPLKA